MTDATETWRMEREELGRRVEEMRRRGICDTCHDIETDGALYGNQYIVYEDALFRVKLETYPRARGHTIVVYKPHREDLSELSENEAGRVFQVSVQMAKGIKAGLKAEKVYLVTMCDGVLNHLHLQPLPRYAGEKIGSTRFVAPRVPLTEGDEITDRIRSALALRP